MRDKLVATLSRFVQIPSHQSMSLHTRELSSEIMRNNKNLLRDKDILALAFYSPTQPEFSLFLLNHAVSRSKFLASLFEMKLRIGNSSWFTSSRRDRK